MKHRCERERDGTWTGGIRPDPNKGTSRAPSGERDNVIKAPAQLIAANSSLSVASKIRSAKKKRQKAGSRFFCLQKVESFVILILVLNCKIVIFLIAVMEVLPISNEKYTNDEGKSIFQFSKCCNKSKQVFVIPVVLTTKRVCFWVFVTKTNKTKFF